MPHTRRPALSTRPARSVAPALFALLFGALGAGPAFAADAPPSVGYTVAFQPGGTALDDGAADFDRIADDLAAYPAGTPLQIEGYYCAEDVLPGTVDADLLALAEQRAVHLKSLLEERGVDTSRVSTIAYGLTPNPARCLGAITAESRAPAGDASTSRFAEVRSPVIGVGLALGQQDGFLAVNAIVDGSPAQRDGSLQAGDRIVAVQPTETAAWQPLAGVTLRQAVSRIRGAAGSVVGLRFQREGNGADQEVYLTRELLTLPPVVEAAPAVEAAAPAAAR